MQLVQIKNFQDFLLVDANSCLGGAECGSVAGCKRLTAQCIIQLSVHT